MTAPDYSASVLETMVGTIASVDRARKQLLLATFAGDVPLTFASALGPSVEELAGRRVSVTIVPISGRDKSLPMVVAVNTHTEGEFWRKPTLDELAQAGGPDAIRTVDDLPADVWPEGESVDDFLAVAMRGRGAYPE